MVKLLVTPLDQEDTEKAKILEDIINYFSDDVEKFYEEKMLELMTTGKTVIKYDDPSFNIFGEKQSIDVSQD